MLTIICRQQYFKTLLQSYETDILLTAYDYSSQQVVDQEINEVFQDSDLYCNSEKVIILACITLTCWTTLHLKTEKTSF